MQSRGKNWLAWMVVSMTLTGCGTETIYRSFFDATVVDGAGEPIMEQAFTHCSTLVLDDGRELDQGCAAVVTDRAGRWSDSGFATDLAEVSAVRTHIEIDRTAIVGETVSLETERVVEQPPEVEVRVQSRYVVDRALLPERVTRFHLTGFVSDGPDPVVSATGTITVEVGLDSDPPVTFSGTGPVTTDDGGFYDAEIDVVSNFFFPVRTDNVTPRVDIEGITGPGDWELVGVEGTDPRVVDAFSSF